MKDRSTEPFSGFLVLFGLLGVGLFAVIALIVNPAIAALVIPLILFSAFCAKGFVLLSPNEAAIFLLFAASSASAARSCRLSMGGRFDFANTNVAIS